MSKQEEKINIKQQYEKDCTLSVESFLKENQINKQGLTTEEVKKRQLQYGKNEVKQSKPKKWYHYLFASFKSPFNLILLGIVAVLFYTEVILPKTPSYANIIVVVILIFISTFLEFFQVFKSNKAAEKLKKLVEVTATVLRDGVEQKVPLNEITVGDVVILAAGELIAADIRIIEEKDLHVVQSMLTGESDSVKKYATSNTKDVEDITDLDTICFMGTNVISGTAKAVIIRTADDTYFGKVAKTLILGKPKTAFQKGIESISKLLIRFMLVLIPLVFLINVIK